MGRPEVPAVAAKIAINGYGTIGKRVADAVARQDDMKVVGVSKTKPNFEARLALAKGLPLYASDAEALEKFQKAGVKALGSLEDMLKEADLVVDCTPEESGYKGLYEKAGVRAIWQGGEEHSLTNLSFNAAANYADCLGASYVRVPSGNPTGLIRTLYPLDAHFGVEKVLAVMVRRAADPGDSNKGSSRRPSSWNSRGTSPGTGPTSTRSPSGGTACTSWTGGTCTTSRPSTRNPTSSR